PLKNLAFHLPTTVDKEPKYALNLTIQDMKNACLRKITVLSFVNKRYMLIYSLFYDECSRWASCPAVDQS
ncbi:MAG: hypothetical protein ACTH13_00680, partial [Streptococcus thermophilus]